MRGRAAGGKTAATVPSVSIAVGASDQASMRVASDTTVDTVFNRAGSRHDTECSLREYELGLAECGG